MEEEKAAAQKAKPAAAAPAPAPASSAPASGGGGGGGGGVSSAGESGMLTLRGQVGSAAALSDACLRKL